MLNEPRKDLRRLVVLIVILKRMNKQENYIVVIQNQVKNMMNMCRPKRKSENTKKEREKKQKHITINDEKLVLISTLILLQ
jgi:hypothetical protein